MNLKGLYASDSFKSTFGTIENVDEGWPLTFFLQTHLLALGFWVESHEVVCKQRQFSECWGHKYDLAR